jgi:hypothetical protein
LRVACTSERPNKRASVQLLIDFFVFLFQDVVEWRAVHVAEWAAAAHVLDEDRGRV